MVAAILGGKFDHRIFILFVPVFIFWIIHGLVTGQAAIRTSRVNRAENPTGYWLVLLFHVVIIGILVYLGLW
jgi:hypothetical protein